MNLPEFTLGDLIRCVEREIRTREVMYPRQIRLGRLSRPIAEREIALMRAVLAALERMP